MSLIHWERLLTYEVVLVAICQLFYIFVLVMLISSEKSTFRKAYFHVFIYTGLVDISLALAVQLFGATRRLGLGPEFQYFGIFLSYLTGTNFSMHVFGNFLLTFCMYTAVCWPFDYAQIWKRPRTFYYIGVVTVIALLSYVEVFRTRRVYTLLKDGSYSDRNVTEMPSLYFMGALTSFLYLFASLFMVMRTLCAIRRVGVNSPNYRRQDKSLVFVALVDCLVFSADVLYELDHLWGEQLFTPEFSQFINLQFNFYLAVMYCMNPFVLLALNRSARDEVFRRGIVNNIVCKESTPPSPARVEK